MDFEIKNDYGIVTGRGLTCRRPVFVTSEVNMKKGNQLRSHWERLDRELDGLRSEVTRRLCERGAVIRHPAANLGDERTQECTVLDLVEDRQSGLRMGSLVRVEPLEANNGYTPFNMEPGGTNNIGLNRDTACRILCFVDVLFRQNTPRGRYCNFQGRFATLAECGTWGSVGVRSPQIIGEYNNHRRVHLFWTGILVCEDRIGGLS